MNKKAIIKLRSTCLILLAILVSMISVTMEDVTEENIKKHLSSDSESVANYISNNVSLFATKYNASENTEGTFKASSVENKFEISVETAKTSQRGIFLDFNDDNGYAIVVDDYCFYDFEITGESPFKDIISEEYCYSTISGYYYLEDGEYYCVDKEFEEYDLNTLCGESIALEIDRYSDPNSISLTNLNNVIEKKYGNGWTLIENESIPMSTGEYSTMEVLSSYICFEYIEDEVGLTSEGNCWIVSAYNLLQSLADASGNYQILVNSLKTNKSKGNMPLSNVLIKYDPSVYEPNIYKKYYDCDENYIGPVIESNSGLKHAQRIVRVNFSFPLLYSEIRKFIDKEYKTTDHQTIYVTMNIINKIGDQYGYTFNAFGTVLKGAYWKQGITSIIHGLPFIISTSKMSNSKYGSHTMAACGYRIYSRSSKWFIFNKTEEICFYEIRDGWEKSVQYLDITDHIGFGAIGLLNKYDKKTNKNGIKYN